MTGNADHAEAVFERMMRARAREILGSNVDGVDLYIQAADIIPGPRYVCARVNLVFLEDIFRMQRNCIKTGSVLRVARRGPASWFRDENIDMEWSQDVGKHDLQFRQDNGALTSCRVPIEPLCRMLSGSPGDEQNRFRWVGGAMLISVDAPEALDDFVAAIIAELPEVAAKETQIRMAARIAEAAGDRPDHAEVSLAPVRRRRVVV